MKSLVLLGLFSLALSSNTLTEDRTQNTELPNVKFVDCETIGLTTHDRCMVIKYANQNLTEYAGLDLFNGDEDVMGGQLYDTRLRAIEESGISLDIGDDGNNASVSL